MKQRNEKTVGKQSIRFDNPPYVVGYASIAGKKEGEGPLANYFDVIEEDPLLGKETWEEAESEFQTRAVNMSIYKAGVTKEQIRYLFGGDLLGQLIATSFGVKEFDIPMFGLYGACSTMGESISLAAMTIDGGYAKYTLSITSSHFASAEKQFRFPLDYGNQRPLAASWTVTGSSAVILGKESPMNGEDGDIVIKGITTGKVTDYGIKDSMNMGACMAPAAADVISHNFMDFNIKADNYDKIITGDLGYVGSDILKDIMKEKGYDISKQHMDCGIEIFDKDTQDTHAGGSGCACSGVTLAGYLFSKLKSKEWKRILFVPTGALLSPVSYNEGKTVPGIAHGVMFEYMSKEGL